MSSLWKNAASIFGYLVSNASQMRATLVTSQSAGCSSSTWIFGNFDTTDLKPRARPCAPVWPSAPCVITIVPSPLIALTSACVTEAPMNSLSGASSVWTLIWSSGAISVSMSMTGNAGFDHLVDRRGQRADAERLDGDEIPLLRGHVVDRRALLDGVELAVEPGHLDVEQLAPIFRRLLALRAPGRLQAGVGERGLQRLRRACPLPWRSPPPSAD